VGRRTLLRWCPLLRWRRHRPSSWFLIEAHSASTVTSAHGHLLHAGQTPAGVRPDTQADASIPYQHPTAARCRPFALDPDVPDHALATREINPGGDHRSASMSLRRPDASQVEFVRFVVRRDIRPRSGLCANLPTLAAARLLDQPCFCPFSRRARMLVVVARGEGGFGAAALQVDPGRVQWAAGQCRTTQRQRGLRTRHRTTRTTLLSGAAPRAACRDHSDRGYLFTGCEPDHADKYAQAAISAITVSQLTGSLRRLPRPLDRILGDSRTLHMPIGGEKLFRGREREAGRSGHPSSGLVRPVVRTRRHGPRRGRPPTPKQ
jgi:hypothetical protein